MIIVCIFWLELRKRNYDARNGQYKTLPVDST